MEWTKLKNIILMILLVLNAALAVLVGRPQLSGYYRTAQANRDAIDFLEQKGIFVAESLIPDPEDLLPQMVERDREEEARLARQLLGEDARQEVRGGEVYRYTSALGVLQFHSDGSFWAKLEVEAFPIVSTGQAAALDVLAKLGFEGVVTDQTEASVTVCQQWQEASLFHQKATVKWAENGISEISTGRRLYGTPVTDPNRRTITQATALIDFYNGLNRMGNVCSRIDAITPGYLSSVGMSRTMTLTPAWYVQTNTGAYRLDLVSGELEQVS